MRRLIHIAECLVFHLARSFLAFYSKADNNRLAKVLFSTQVAKFFGHFFIFLLLPNSVVRIIVYPRKKPSDVKKLSLDWTMGMARRVRTRPGFNRIIASAIIETEIRSVKIKIKIGIFFN